MAAGEAEAGKCYNRNMITDELIVHIRREMKNGVSTDNIKFSLLRNGWTQGDMDEAFKVIDNNLLQSNGLQKRSKVFHSIQIALFLMVAIFFLLVVQKSSFLAELSEIFHPLVFLVFGVPIILILGITFLVFNAKNRKNIQEDVNARKGASWANIIISTVLGFILICIVLFFILSK